MAKKSKANLGRPESEWSKARAEVKPEPKKRVRSFKNSPTFDKVYGNPQKPPKKTNKKRVFVKE